MRTDKLSISWELIHLSWLQLIAFFFSIYICILKLFAVVIQYRNTLRYLAVLPYWWIIWSMILIDWVFSLLFEKSRLCVDSWYSELRRNVYPVCVLNKGDLKSQPLKLSHKFGFFSRFVFDLINHYSSKMCLRFQNLDKMHLVKWGKTRVQTRPKPCNRPRLLHSCYN